MHMLRSSCKLRGVCGCQQNYSTRQCIFANANETKLMEEKQINNKWKRQRKRHAQKLI